jgi:hypothetical protein
VIAVALLTLAVLASGAAAALSWKGLATIVTVRSDRVNSTLVHRDCSQASASLAWAAFALRVGPKPAWVIDGRRGGGSGVLDGMLSPASSAIAVGGTDADDAMALCSVAHGPSWPTWLPS